MGAAELRAWPLGEVPRNSQPERPPGRTTGRCARVPRLLGDWHDQGRSGGPHRAQDIMAPRGTPVLAPVAARVVRSSADTGPQPNGGHGVSLVTQQGSRVSLLHFDRPPVVHAGDRVEVGQLLGVVGNTGARASTTCPHLHIEMVSGGEHVNLYSRLLELQVMARAQATEATQPARDAIRAMQVRAQGWYREMRPRMTRAEREQFQRGVVTAYSVALRIAQRTDADSQRDAMGRAVAATQVWERLNTELGSTSRIVTAPFTVAQNAAYEAAQNAARAAQALRAELPTLAASAGVGVVFTALVGLYLLSEIAKGR